MKKPKYELGDDDRRDVVKRTYKFALRIIQLANKLPNSSFTYPIRDQLIRSGTSVGSDAEEASAGFSRSDFIFKMSVASKEAREANYWLRLIRDSEIAKTDDLAEEINEAITESNELKKILTSIVKTSKERK
ncbi:MAG TPA: four helix bundle protein [Syntrophales bacterium]|jgi:four helix bundle protein|nr:four helix bundle protein [Syntrophales bacterium]